MLYVVLLAAVGLLHFFMDDYPTASLIVLVAGVGGLIFWSVTEKSRKAKRQKEIEILIKDEEALDKSIKENNAQLIDKYPDELLKTDKNFKGANRKELIGALKIVLKSKGYDFRNELPSLFNIKNHKNPKIERRKKLTKKAIKDGLNECYKYYKTLVGEIEKQNTINLAAVATFQGLALKEESRTLKDDESKGEWLKVMIEHTEEENDLGLFVCLFTKMKGTGYERFYLDEKNVREFNKNIFVLLLQYGTSYSDCEKNFSKYLDFIEKYRSIENADRNDFLSDKLRTKQSVDPRKAFQELYKLRRGR